MHIFYSSMSDQSSYLYSCVLFPIRYHTLYQIIMTVVKLRCCSIFFILALAHNGSETSTFATFQFKERMKEKDKSRPTCAPHPAGTLALSLADCELSAQITGAKKQESLGSLSRDNSRPFFVCSHCNKAPQKYPTKSSTCVD